MLGTAWLLRLSGSKGIVSEERKLKRNQFLLSPLLPPSDVSQKEAYRASFTALLHLAYLYQLDNQTWSLCLASILWDFPLLLRQSTLLPRRCSQLFASLLHVSWAGLTPCMQTNTIFPEEEGIKTHQRFCYRLIFGTFSETWLPEHPLWFYITSVLTL